MLCYNNCGNKAKFILKNGKHCCSKSINACPAKIAKYIFNEKSRHVGSANGNWTDNPTIGTLHKWVGRRILKSDRCPKCNSSAKLQLSCTDHKYTRDLAQWEYLCQKCHKIKDKQVGRTICVYFCKICNKIISRTSGKYGMSRCNSCAKTIDKRKRRK